MIDNLSKKIPMHKNHANSQNPDAAFLRDPLLFEKLLAQSITANMTNAEKETARFSVLRFISNLMGYNKDISQA